MNIDNMHDKFWDDVAPGLRRALGLRPLTREEAERAYDEACEVEITDTEIEQLLAAAKSDIPREPPFDSHDGSVSDSPIAEDVSYVCRNEGDQEEPDVKDLMDKQRRENLEDDAEDQNAKKTP